jgi:formamidopyrimidine-DNA glycosylase
MPELPEVETMRRGLAPVVGLRIAAVRFPRGLVRPLSVRPRPHVVSARLVGRSIATVGRRGKRVVLGIAAPPAEPHAWLVIEPRMTGLMLLADPPTLEHVRLVVDFDSPAAGPSRRPLRMLFWDRRGLGTIRLFDARGLESVCGAARLGPDGLLVTGEELAARLGSSRRAIKVALLDQRAVAGVGNIYAAEILHRVGIDPRTACRSIPVTGWQAIADATRLVLAEAVRFAGSSIGDRTYRAVDGRPGRFQHRHRVYGREGRACATCGGSVTRIVQAQRSTFFCPGCQPRGRRGAGGRRPGRSGGTRTAGIR